MLYQEALARLSRLAMDRCGRLGLGRTALRARRQGVEALLARAPELAEAGAVGSEVGGYRGHGTTPDRHADWRLPEAPSAYDTGLSASRRPSGAVAFDEADAG